MITYNNTNSAKLTGLFWKNKANLFNGVDNLEINTTLNRIAFFCYNALILCSIFILGSNYGGQCFLGVYQIILDISLLLSLMLELFAVRSRQGFSIWCSALLNVSLIAFAALGAYNYYILDGQLKFGLVFYALFIVFTVIRLIFLNILYSVVTFKKENFFVDTTVFLKPTNTPVTFSSVLAPEPLDPTNPYHPKTVYTA